MFLSIHGDEREEIYEALSQHREDIDRELDGAIWDQGNRECSVTLQIDGVLSDDETDDDRLRQWMAGNMLQLREVTQPRLKQVMQELRPGPEDADASG